MYKARWNTISGLEPTYEFCRVERLAHFGWLGLKAENAPLELRLNALNEYAAYGSELQQDHPSKKTEVLYKKDEVERIKNAVPLVAFLSGFVELRPIASGAIGHCPFHEDHNPSFGVNREGNYWHCFAGCGGGSVIEFWMKFNNCDFNTAVKELKEMFEICIH